MINYVKIFLILFIGLLVMFLGKILVLIIEKIIYELEGYLEILWEEGLIIIEVR